MKRRRAAGWLIGIACLLAAGCKAENPEQSLRQYIGEINVMTAQQQVIDAVYTEKVAPSKEAKTALNLMKTEVAGPQQALVKEVEAIQPEDAALAALHSHYVKSVKERAGAYAAYLAAMETNSQQQVDEAKKREEAGRRLMIEHEKALLAYAKAHDLTLNVRQNP